MIIARGQNMPVTGRMFASVMNGRTRALQAPNISPVGLPHAVGGMCEGRGGGGVGQAGSSNDTCCHAGVTREGENCREVGVG